MIEAVNSVLSNAQYTRAAAEQQSVASSYAANPARIQQAAAQAPYISLFIKVDVNFDKAILQIRDSDTGDVVRQIPTESQLEAYRRAQSSNSVKPAKAEDVADRVIIREQPEVEVPKAAPVEVKETSAPEAKASAPAAAPTPAPQAAPVSIDTQA